MLFLNLAALVDAGRGVARKDDKHATMRVQSWTIDPVDEHVYLIDACIAFTSLAEPLGHFHGWRVLRMNQADDVVLIELLECIRERAPPPFGRVAFTPRVSRQRPSDLEAGPSFGIQKTDAADHAPRRFFFDGPMSVSANLPMPDEKRHAAPRLRAAEHLSAQELHHRRVRGQLRIVVEVAFAPHPQLQAIGLELV